MPATRRTSSCAVVDIQPPEDSAIAVLPSAFACLTSGMLSDISHEDILFRLILLRPLIARSVLRLVCVPNVPGDVK